MKAGLAAVGGAVLQMVIVFAITVFVTRFFHLSEDMLFAWVIVIIHVAAAIVGGRIAIREGGNTKGAVVLMLLFGLAALAAFLVSDSPQKIVNQEMEAEANRRDIAARAAMQRRASRDLPVDERQRRGDAKESSRIKHRTAQLPGARSAYLNILKPTR